MNRRPGCKGYVLRENEDRRKRSEKISGPKLPQTIGDDLLSAAAVDPDRYFYFFFISEMLPFISASSHPNATISESRAPRHDFERANSPIASRRFVLPAPFAPYSKLIPGEKVAVCPIRLRKDCTLISVNIGNLPTSRSVARNRNPGRRRGVRPSRFGIGRAQAVPSNRRCL